MIIWQRRARAVLLGTLLPFAGVTCNDRHPTDSTRLVARLGFSPVLATDAATVYRNLTVFGLELDNIRVQLKRASGEVATDTVIGLAIDADEVRVELVVQLRSPVESLQAQVELRAGEVVLFRGEQTVVLRPGSTSAEQSPLQLSYIGPGANATSLTIAPSVVSLFTSDSVDFTVTALDANQQSVSAVAIAWLIRDATLGAVSATGRFKPALLRGETFVIAKLPTGLQDSARVSIIPLPSEIALISGGGQSGLVGTLLAQPIVVELRAPDNKPVPGYQVDFAITSGGGALSVARTLTDATGRASTNLTVGLLPGLNVVSVSAPGVAPITVTATGLISLAAVGPN